MDNLMWDYYFEIKPTFMWKFDEISNCWLQYMFTVYILYNTDYRKRFFETGIERIAQQVINPKLNTNFVPKIEDVAYKFLGTFES